MIYDAGAGGVGAVDLRMLEEVLAGRRGAGLGGFRCDKAEKCSGLGVWVGVSSGVQGVCCYCFMDR